MKIYKLKIYFAISLMITSTFLITACKKNKFAKTDVKVILYSGDNFTGTSFELASSSSYVSAFNDKASSIKVIALN